MRHFIIFFPALLIFSSCYGPVRFATKATSDNKNSHYVDSLRISKALSTSKEDSAHRFATDLEFTEDELKEVIQQEEYSKPIENVNDFFNNYSRMDTTSSLPTNYEKLLMTVISYLGTPYKFGGNTRKGLDCSAFTRLIFLESLNIELPRSTIEQIKIGSPVESGELKFGDLVFFNTRRRQNPGHVGIYLWDGYFVHASTKYGVVVSSMNSGYYNKRFVGARRLEEIYQLTQTD